jgi:hypothetical protein
MLLRRIHRSKLSSKSTLLDGRAIDPSGSERSAGAGDELGKPVVATMTRVSSIRGDVPPVF